MIELLCSCDPSAVAAWIQAIPFEAWPQQTRLADGKIRPAMVTDLRWHGFGEATDALIEWLRPVVWMGGIAFNRMLSVVMPGHSIDPHRDAQHERWITRVHVPLTTNPLASFVVEDVSHHLEVGWAYKVDTRKTHAVRNDGGTPRIHLMFDVMRP